MLTHRARGIINLVLLLVMIIVLFALARFTSRLYPQIAVVIVGGLAIGVLAFVRQDIAAIALVFSMILSPEIKVASLPGREVVVRLDDVLLVIFFFSWLFKMAYFKNLGILRITPLNTPIMVYILVAMISTSWAAALGEIQFVASLFYFLKYVEYFMIFFMFSNIIQTEDQLRRLLAAFLIVAAVVSVYGFYQVAIGVPRISAPFEGEGGEANTFGGYLLLVIGIVAMTVFKAPDIRVRLAYWLGLLALLALVLATYSRSSYLGLLALGLGCLLFVTPRMRAYLAAAMFVVLLASPFIMPEKVKERVLTPFQGETEPVAPFLNLNTEDSAYQKVNAARLVITLWKERPILGRGVTGVGLVDSQYPRVLGETGIIGLICFFWILVAIFGSFRAAMKALDGFPEERVWQWRAVVTGYCCALFGLMFHAVGARTLSSSSASWSRSGS